MPNVAIVLAPIGEYRAPRCVIDEFIPGEITVTSLDHCQEIAVFREGEWKYATAYDDQGYPVAMFDAGARPRRSFVAARMAS